MSKTLTIIIGAGASHDLIGNRFPRVYDDFTPPLASQLFTADPTGIVSLGSHGTVAREILELYPQARAAASLLAGGLRGKQTLEAAIRAMQDSPEEHIRRMFVQVPVYLRHLFWDISRRYTTEPVNYTHLLSRVLTEGFERVGIITTNYDTFLEAALTSIFGVSFTQLSSYIADKRWALVKLHGSVNWAIGLRGFGQPPDRDHYLKLLDELSRTTKEGVRERFETMHLWNQDSLWDEKGPRYPALVVPVEGKYEYLCPTEHVDTARELIARSNNFLIVGSSGLDDDLIDLLVEKVNFPVLTLGIVSKGDVHDIRSRFSRAPMFTMSSPMKIRTGNKGFSQFIADGRLAEFLQMLYDDDNRDAWLAAEDQQR